MHCSDCLTLHSKDTHFENSNALIGAVGYVASNSLQSEMEVINCTLSHNKANLNGGGLALRFNHILVMNSSIMQQRINWGRDILLF